MKFLKDKSIQVKVSVFTVGIIFAVFLFTVAIRAVQIKKNNSFEPLSQNQAETLEAIKKSSYPEQYKTLKKLPYNTTDVKLNVKAESAILVNTNTGNIVYEKNADQVIPPASLTKIAVMFVVGKEIESGKVSLDDIVPLSESSWACNMMPHSSLMFLGKNQIVTLRELLTGLSVCSGNDASYAIAEYISGGMEEFLDRMNFEVKNLGLEKTHFVEASGYSEENTTTAREMAVLCTEYILRFPHFIKEFHSVLDFSYPKEHNLAPEDKNKARSQDFSNGIPQNITMQITQKNTNPLLLELEGCDGLKTGFIEESGYNLALTVIRNGMRFLSVTLKGPGKNLIEGQEGRKADGKEIMEWAFKTFVEYKNPYILRDYSIPLVKAKQTRSILTPAYKPKALLVPFYMIKESPDPLSEIKTDVEFPKYISGKVEAGTEFGKIIYSVNGIILEEIPLIADRTIEKSNFFISIADSLAQFSLLF